MAVVFRYKGFRLFFSSNEGNPREPAHIHIRHGEASAKFWLLPAVELDSSFGFSASTLGELQSVVSENRDLLERSSPSAIAPTPAGPAVGARIPDFHPRAITFSAPRSASEASGVTSCSSVEPRRNNRVDRRSFTYD